MADPVEALADHDEEDNEVCNPQAHGLINDDLNLMHIAKYIKLYPGCGYEIVSLIFFAN
jgi:hypothetical protein